MPLEVNEIGIRLRVDDADEEDGGGREPQEREADDCGCGSLDRGEIVDDCVRRVLQVLKSMRER